MGKRHSDALLIQQGACNPSGIALTLHNACVEAMQEGKGTKGVCEDAAVRLIAHQLAFLVNVAELDASLTEYGRLTLICQNNGTEPEQEPEVEYDGMGNPLDGGPMPEVDTALEEGTRFERAFGDRSDAGD
jgi:hypothetical protein